MHQHICYSLASYIKSDYSNCNSINPKNIIYKHKYINLFCWIFIFYFFCFFNWKHVSPMRWQLASDWLRQSGVCCRVIGGGWERFRSTWVLVLSVWPSSGVQSGSRLEEKHHVKSQVFGRKQEVTTWRQKHLRPQLIPNNTSKKSCLLEFINQITLSCNRHHDKKLVNHFHYFYDKSEDFTVLENC